MGYFHQAHTAIDDSCLAQVFELPTAVSPAFAVLLEQVRKKTMRVWAEQSPFDLKDTRRRSFPIARVPLTSFTVD